MTEQEQRIALSKWADKHGLRMTFMDDDGCEQVGLLDTSSLDVLHEIIVKLPDQDHQGFIDRQRFIIELYSLLGLSGFPLLGEYGHINANGLFMMISATANKLREALCRTLFSERFK